MKVQFIVAVATVLLSAVPSAFAAEPALRGAILASDSFLDKKSGEKGGSGKQKSGKDRKGRKDDKDRKGRKDDKDRKYKGRKDYKDWYKKDRKGNECWDRTADKCEKQKGCRTFEDKKRGLLFCAPKNFDSKRKGGRKYFKGKEKDVSFAAKKISVDKKSVRKVKGLDKKTVRILCKDLKGARRIMDKKALRRLCGKKMESEDYYDFEVESDYDSGDSSEDSFVAKSSGSSGKGGGKFGGHKGSGGKFRGNKKFGRKYFGRGNKKFGRKYFGRGRKSRRSYKGFCASLDREECKRSSICSKSDCKKKSEDYYDFEEESPDYDSEDSSYSEDFEDEDLFDSEDFSEDFDSEDFDSEDFDSEDFDSEDFDFDYEDFDSEDFE